MSAGARLRVYRFGSDAAFEGGLVAAIERMQLLGDAKVLDALAVIRDADSGTVDALDLSTGGGDSPVSLLDFRLDPALRAPMTERTLADHPGGVPRAVIEELGATLDSGGAIFVILHTGEAVDVLDDAVARSNGRLLVNEDVDARMLSEVAPRLSAALTP